MLAKNSQAAAMKYLLLCAQQSAAVFVGLASKQQQQAWGHTCPSALAAIEGGLSTTSLLGFLDVRVESVGLIRLRHTVTAANKRMLGT